MSMNALQFAHHYVKHGLPVFPCGIDKRPLVQGGFKAASKDPDQISKWWTTYLGAMIGIPTGQASGLVVIDVDVKNGVDGFESLKQLESLPKTLMVKTPSGGAHLYFNHDPDRPLRNSISQLGPGLDVRGDGGYIIAAGSVGSSGSYEVTCDLPVADCPTWISDFLQAKKAHSAPAANPDPSPANDRYVQAAIHGEIGRLATAPKGQRNDALNRAAFSLGTLVGQGGLTEQEAHRTLISGAAACGLLADDEESAVQATIKSGLGAGMANPRQVPDKAKPLSAGSSDSASDKVWHYPYEMTHSGLWLQKKDDTSEPLCGPFEVIGQCRTNLGDRWGLMIEFYDGDRRKKTHIIPRADLISERGEAMAALASQGLKFPPGATKKLKTALASLDPEARVKIVENAGWVEPGQAYILGDRPIGAKQSEPVRLIGDAQPMRLAGNFEQWRDLVALPSSSNTRLVLAISAAFVGPLLALTGSEGLGLHFRGASSSGKSTALAVAASVAGVPLGTWRATGNGLEGIAAASNDGLLILDELGEVSAREVASVIYMLGNGQGKQRAGQTGEARKRKTWRVAVLSSGEVSIAQKAQEDGSKAKTRAGQEVRLIDIEADAGAGLGVFEKVPHGLTPSQFSDNLKEAANKHSGDAMPLFIEALQADMGKLVLLLFNQLKSDFASTFPDINGQAARVRDKFALLACAGEFATQCGLTGWNNGEATRSAKVCFEAWFYQRKGASHEASLAIQTVLGFIQSHGASRFHAYTSDGLNSRINDRVGWVRDVKGERCYCFASVPWQQEVLAGQDVKLASLHLFQKGLLITDVPEANGRQRFTYKLTTPDGPQNVYAVRASIVLDGEG